MHIVGDTETEVVGSANSGTKGRDSDQGDQIIWVPPSDDELSDADGEEDAGEFLGVAPLGTSDLDIRDNWFAAGRRKDFNNMSEEDELQEVVSSRTADDVAKTVALTLSQFSEVGHPSDLDGAWFYSIRNIVRPTLIRSLYWHKSSPGGPAGPYPSVYFSIDRRR